ncbi:MAG: flagellar biosynthesis protein FlhB [Fretibacterium sp.]|nr:flagellar biosynthesis protein FlhB [Fretibacterium sp.]
MKKDKFKRLPSIDAPPRFFGRFELQFFAQERTEPATPRKRQKVRSEGKVCSSKDLIAAVEILTGLLGLLFLGGIAFNSLTDFLRQTLFTLGDGILLREGWFTLVGEMALWSYFTSWLPLGLLVMLLSVAVIVWQVGWTITTEPFKFNLDRMNPVSGMKKIISLRSIAELLKGLLKASLFAIVIYIALKDRLPETLKALELPLGSGAVLLWDMLWDLSMRLAVMLLVIGLADYLYQKWEFERSIRMSRQEIKEEFRQMEGDPQVKSKIRQKQREMAQKRMMASVPTADVVITNPTTLAVALSYDRKVMSAPQVVAKGQGFIAARIRELALEAGVPVVEDKPLAWALYEGVEIGMEISEELYRGVAEILAMVYRMKA